MLDTRPAGIWRRGLATLAALGARLPSQCAVCHAWPAQRLCAACCARFAPRLARCATCACVVHGGVAQCGQCLLHPPPLDACLAAVDYGYPWSQLLAQFKFQDDPGWATALAALMRQTPGAQELLEQADWVLPVPLAPGRLRHRGYNQALLLARHFAPRKTDATLLLRTRHTPAQSELTRAERLRNVRGAFAVEPLRAHELRDRRVVLVDDVMTSGASLHAASLALRQAGAAHITALVFARTEVV